MDSRPKIRSNVEKERERTGGFLHLHPAWVARSFLPPGKRLGLPETEYHLGERGAICERWLASTTEADNAVKVPDEGLSTLTLNGDPPVTLRAVIEAAPDLIMGAAYAATHNGLGRLAKIFDYGDRLPYHLHQMKRHASLLGRNSKEESYFFPDGVDLGPHPESFLGVHPYIHREKKYELLLPYLKDWNSDHILKFSKAYKLLPNDGFHIPAGTLHAPGSALTIELQEDSDVLAMLQAKVSDHPIDKELLFKDVRKEDRQARGEAAILEMVNWDVSADPYFYENRHTPPVPISDTGPSGGTEEWIFYNSTRFSGKRVVVRAGGKFTGQDRGVYSILVWRGKGRIDGGPDIAGGDPEKDELVVCHDRATKPLSIENTGREELVLFKFFGPDINDNVPMLKEVHA